MTLSPAPSHRTSAFLPEPLLSVVVLAWDQLIYTRPCVESLRQHTDVPYELILVDNGSAPNASSYAQQVGDVAILNPCNEGFARGMNQGLAAARGRYVAFLNNDTVVPPKWASRLVESLEKEPRAGLVVPAVTAAGIDRTVRKSPGELIERLPPFEATPSAVLYLMPTAMMRNLGGWSEEFEVASGEDADLCFRLWVNNRDIVFDQRVLIQHVGKGTAIKLPDWRRTWEKNLEVFLDKWTSGDPSVRRLATCPPELFARNVEIARSVALWMDRYFRLRSRCPARLVLIPRVAQSRLAAGFRFLIKATDGPRARRFGRAVQRRPLRILNRRL